MAGFSKAIKKVALAGAVASLFMGAAHAGMLNDAFDAMNDTRGPSTYSNQVRTGVSFGAGRVGSPVRASTRIRLLEVTPPSINAGCSGISYHLGGLSFINLDEIVNLLENALAATPYVAMSLAISAISDKLEEVLGEALAFLQKATSMSMDSCELARAAVGWGADVMTGMCQQQSAGANDSPSYMAARSEACSSLEDTRRTIDDAVTSASCAWGLIGSGSDCEGPVDPERTTLQNIIPCIGNCTWAAMKQRGLVDLPKNPDAIPTGGGGSGPGMGTTAEVAYQTSIAMGELLQSVTGVIYRPTGVVHDPDNPELVKEYAEKMTAQSADNPEERYIRQTISPKDAVAWVLCGPEVLNAVGGREKGEAVEKIAEYLQAQTGAPSVNEHHTSSAVTVFEVCGKAFGGMIKDGGLRPDSKILTCHPNSLADPVAVFDTGDGSGAVSPASISELIRYKSDCTFITKVPFDKWAEQAYVGSVFDRGILTNVFVRMIQIHDKLVAGEELEAAQVQFIDAAPFPLYRLLNMATLFPGMADGLVNNVAHVLGMMYTSEFFNHFFRTSFGRADSSARADVTHLKEITKTIDELVKTNAENIVVIDHAMERATLLTQKVNQMERALLEQIYARGLMGNYSFAQDMFTGRAGS